MAQASTVESKDRAPTLWALITLSFIPFIMVLGNSMLIPVLPTVSKVLNVTSFQVSLLITLFSIPAAIVIPLAGILSDRVGRKKVVILCLLLYGLGGLLAGFSSIWKGGSFTLLLASRIIQGIGAAGTAPIAMVLVGDLYKKQNRSKALGIIEASNAMGKVLSPILGSLIAMITWYAMFFAFPLLCVPAAVALWKLVDEPAAKEKPQPLSEYKQHIIKIFHRQGKWMSVAFLAGAIIMFTMFGVLFYLSDFLEKIYKIDGMFKGVILAIPLLALCLTAYLSGSHVKEKTNKMKKFILIGLVLATLSVAAVPWFKNVYWLVGCSFFIGIGSGLILPCLNTLITSAIGLQERGIITALYNSVRFFGVALGPPVFSSLSNRPFPLFIGLGIMLIITFFLALIFIRRPQRLKGKDGQTRLLLRKKRLSPV
ncbi:MFS transporter [Thermoactinomyces sp. CICC 10521]|uniref:MFS transporter n=1 Tax=Thermoactinomyces sp. CICC 10521 TaxID=2767426 RepID=UPI0018DBDB25|nr:MFS transporter [Thermoactinomyces sp. CICC 10521]MBH8606684.1 MFS transporter [Thermoactinomyces sp. CICC 10521]